jgi:hypothetical protein
VRVLFSDWEANMDRVKRVSIRWVLRHIDGVHVELRADLVGI